MIFEAASRLKETQIENQDALQLLQRYDYGDVLAYVDPPYLMDTRKGRYYQTEFEDARQTDLLDILREFSGKVILSGYDNDLYNRWLSDWYKLEFQSNAEAGQRRVEVIWCNFEPAGQLSIFE